MDIYRAASARFPVNKWRTGDLENLKKKNCPNSAPDRSSTESRPLLQRCFGSVWTELNCQTSSFLDFPLKIYSASLGFFLIWLRKAIAIAVAFRCCGLYIGRAVKNKITNGGYRLVWETLNCWMILQLTCFPTSYGTIYVCFNPWFFRICFDRATARLFVSATHHGASFIFAN